MSLIPLRFWTNPALALGVFTFQNNRLATYESLLGFLENRDNAATIRVQETFDTWAKRDRARMETRHLVFGAIARRLKIGGATVAGAMRPFITTEEYLIISAGETNGKLAEALRLLIRNVSANQGMLSSVFSALAQPALGLITLLILSYVFGKSLWPDLMRAIPPKFWPSWALPCIDAQIWFAKHWYVLFVLAGLVAAYYITLNKWVGKSRDWADKLPPWSINKGKQASAFLGVMSALIEAGRTVGEAFVDIRDKSDPYMRWQITRILTRYAVAGKDAMSCLRTGLFNPMILDQVEDASSGREFGPGLAHAGSVALQTVLRVVNAQAQAAGVTLTATVGLVFLYITAVTTIGIQEATDSLIRGVGGAVM